MIFKCNSDNLDYMNGYQNCMNDLITYLKETTGFKPEKRMIDAVPILDGAIEVAYEIKHKLEEIEVKDEI